MQNGRSNNVLRLRAAMPTLFPNLQNASALFLRDAHATREKHVILQQLLKFNPKEDKYPVFSPFLYPEGKKNLAKVFQNIALPFVRISLLIFCFM
jgi:hypothetical protein